MNQLSENTQAFSQAIAAGVENEIVASDRYFDLCKEMNGFTVRDLMCYLTPPECRDILLEPAPKGFQLVRAEWGVTRIGYFFLVPESEILECEIFQPTGKDGLFDLERITPLVIDLEKHREYRTPFNSNSSWYAESNRQGYHTNIPTNTAKEFALLQGY